MTRAHSAGIFRVAKSAVGLALALALIGAAAAATGPRQEKVQFAKGASSAVIKGHLKGDADVDYVVRAAVGQTLSVTLKETNPQNYFNVLPPGSKGSAMFVGDTGEDYTAMLPSDGTATVDIAGAAENRSILFVKGKPVASNASRIDVLSSERKGDVTVVKLGESERYEVPDALLTGG